MKCALLLALATASLVACSGPEFSARPVGGDVGAQSADELLAEGRFNFRNSNFALAVASFRRAIRQAPESVDAYNGLAASYDRLGRFDLARRYYEEALALAPADPRVRHNFAISLRMQGMTREAAMLENGESVPTEVASADPVATTPADSVTIMLPPSPAPAAAAAAVTATASALPRLPYAMPRLERMSTGEVALVTRPESARAAPAAVAQRAPSPARMAAAPVRVAAMPRATPLPVRTVRDTRQQVVMEIGTTPRAAPATSRSSFRILNAVGRRGQAGRMQSHLRAAGWNPTGVGDATIRRGRSFLLASPGQMREAQALARTLPFRPPVYRSTRIRQTMLFLGRDALAFDDQLRRS